MIPDALDKAILAVKAKGKVSFRLFGNVYVLFRLHSS